MRFQENENIAIKFLFPSYLWIVNNTSRKNLLISFRNIAMVEGLSYLILLLIAMPLKYLADIHEAVKYTGWVHGLLFVIYCVLLGLIMLRFKWPLKRGIIYFVASLIPLGTFFLDKPLKKEIANEDT